MFTVYLIFSKTTLQRCPGVIWDNLCYGGATKVAKFDLTPGADEKIFNLKIVQTYKCIITLVEMTKQQAS